MTTKKKTAASTKPAPTRKKAAAPKRTKSTRDIDIRDHIVIHCITEEPHCGWMHTHGMAELGLPELEIRSVPLFLSPDAANLLNHIAQYMYDGKNGLNDARPVKLGQRLGVGPMQIVQFVKLMPIPGEEDHYANECWALSDSPLRHACDMHHPPQTLH